MKITSLVENTSSTGLPVEHGLSLYIQKENTSSQGSGDKVGNQLCRLPEARTTGSVTQNILFDMGQRRLFAENAERLGVSISDVDIAVISHGHYDHGGGLRTFLEQNSKAKVYIHKDAFLPHYSLRENGLAYIGLDEDLVNNDRLVICDNVNHINKDLTLFADVHGDCCCPVGNRLLYGPRKDINDTFSHEQNLVIEDGGNIVLFAGCAHNGIVNIIRKAEEVIGKTPTHVFGGMHLVKSGLSAKEEDTFVSLLADNLMTYQNTMFYTMHCTGTEQFLKLKDIMGNQIEYLSCGDSVNTSPARTEGIL